MKTTITLIAMFLFVVKGMSEGAGDSFTVNGLTVTKFETKLVAVSTFKLPEQAARLSDEQRYELAKTGEVKMSSELKFLHLKEQITMLDVKGRIYSKDSYLPSVFIVVILAMLLLIGFNRTISPTMKRQFVSYSFIFCLSGAIAFAMYTFGNGELLNDKGLISIFISIVGIGFLSFYCYAFFRRWYILSVFLTYLIPVVLISTSVSYVTSNYGLKTTGYCMILPAVFIIAFIYFRSLLENEKTTGEKKYKPIHVPEVKS